jgi:hypothetical protein
VSVVLSCWDVYLHSTFVLGELWYKFKFKFNVSGFLRNEKDEILKVAGRGQP